MGPSNYKGTVGAAFFDGYPGLTSDENNAIRSEFGQPELTVYPNGTYELTTSPVISDLPKGTVIFNEEQTKRILKNSGKKGNAFAEGTTGGGYLSMHDVMPEKAAIFDKFQANLKANLDAIKVNAIDMGRNIADITKAVTNNTIGTSVVLNGGINVTCPGVTEAEVARNLGTVISSQIGNMFNGMALRADQRALRK